MSCWLTLARETEEISKPLPDTQTKGDKSPARVEFIPFCRVLSGCQAENTEKALLQDSAPEAPFATTISRDDLDTFAYGRTVAEKPQGWTGQVVSLKEWKRLKESEHRDLEVKHRNTATGPTEMLEDPT